MPLLGTSNALGVCMMGWLLHMLIKRACGCTRYDKFSKFVGHNPYQAVSRREQIVRGLQTGKCEGVA
jgi:hypothetical protein